MRYDKNEFKYYGYDDKPFNLNPVKADHIGINDESFEKIYTLLFEKNNIDEYSEEIIISVGNIMNFNIPLYYPTLDEKYIETYADKTEWVKIEPHRGDLWLYEDLGHNGLRISVGTYDYCWDYKSDAAIATFRYNPDLIINLVRKINRNSKIIYRIESGLAPEMSTEYLADLICRNGKLFQINFQNDFGEKKLRGIAIVEFGNCDANNCAFEIINKY